ncbi:MAG: tRNA lysidine(34) synthetase TilS [Anaerolineales bacterium]|nr:tRNA lysidine(34) synthetase TilS [Anaerolineales bacterium]
MNHFTAGETVLVGVSGGPDSLCLLHGLVDIRDKQNLNICVGHLDHQLRPDSSKDAKFVERTCSEWGVPCTIKSVDVNQLADKLKLGVEEAGRQARLDFLTDLAKSIGANKIALGHNADDQAETVLMHILRGAGLDGLEGIAGIRTLGKIYLVRPLLTISRSDIEAYCHEHQLEPHIDSSNRDRTYFRNRIRHDIMPYLEKYAPGIRNRLRQLSELATADVALLNSHLNDCWNSLVLEQTTNALSLDLKLLNDLPKSLRRRTIRRAFNALRGSLRDLGYVHVENACNLAESGRTGDRIDLPGMIAIEIRYDRLLFFTRSEPGPIPINDIPVLIGESTIQLTVPGTTHLSETDWLVETSIIHLTRHVYSQAKSNPDRWRAYIDYDSIKSSLVLRSRIDGEKFQPLGLKGSMLVSDFMSNERIPFFLRNSIPILSTSGTSSIIWIVGWRIDDRFKIKERTVKVLKVRFIRRADS